MFLQIARHTLQIPQISAFRRPRYELQVRPPLVVWWELAEEYILYQRPNPAT